MKVNEIPASLKVCVHLWVTISWDKVVMLLNRCKKDMQKDTVLLERTCQELA